MKPRPTFANVAATLGLLLFVAVVPATALAAHGANRRDRTGMARAGGCPRRSHIGTAVISSGDELYGVVECNGETPLLLERGQRRWTWKLVVPNAAACILRQIHQAIRDLERYVGLWEACTEVQESDPSLYNAEQEWEEQCHERGGRVEAMEGQPYTGKPGLIHPSGVFGEGVLAVCAL